MVILRYVQIKKIKKHKKFLILMKIEHFFFMKELNNFKYIFIKL